MSQVEPEKQPPPPTPEQTAKGERWLRQFDQSEGPLRHYLYRRNIPSDSIKDCLQDARLRVWTKAIKADDRTPPDSFMFQAARWAALDYWRDVKKHRATEKLDDVHEERDFEDDMVDSIQRSQPELSGLRCLQSELRRIMDSPDLAGATLTDWQVFQAHYFGSNTATRESDQDENDLQALQDRYSISSRKELVAALDRTCLLLARRAVAAHPELPGELLRRIQEGLALGIGMELLRAVLLAGHVHLPKQDPITRGLFECRDAYVGPTHVKGTRTRNKRWQTFELWNFWGWTGQRIVDVCNPVVKKLGHPSTVSEHLKHVTEFCSGRLLPRLIDTSRLRAQVKEALELNEYLKVSKNYHEFVEEMLQTAETEAADRQRGAR